MTLKALTVRLPDEVHEALRTYAFANKTSMNETVCIAVQKLLAASEPEVFDTLLEEFRSQYRVALDKLADL